MKVAVDATGKANLELPRYDHVLDFSDPDLIAKTQQLADELALLSIHEDTPIIGLNNQLILPKGLPRISGGGCPFQETAKMPWYFSEHDPIRLRALGEALYKQGGFKTIENAMNFCQVYRSYKVGPFTHGPSEIGESPMPTTPDWESWLKKSWDAMGGREYHAIRWEIFRCTEGIVVVMLRDLYGRIRFYMLHPDDSLFIAPDTWHAYWSFDGQPCMLEVTVNMNIHWDQTVTGIVDPVKGICTRWDGTIVPITKEINFLTFDAYYGKNFDLLMQKCIEEGLIIPVEETMKDWGKFIEAA